MHALCNERPLVIGNPCNRFKTSGDIAQAFWFKPRAQSKLNFLVPWHASTKFWGGKRDKSGSRDTVLYVA
jgi:hypothetical protein